MPQGNNFFMAGQWAGVENQNKRIEAFMMMPVQGAVIQYRGHVQNKGWMEWKPLGEWIGTKGESLRLEAI